MGQRARPRASVGAVEAVADAYPGLVCSGVGLDRCYAAVDQQRAESLSDRCQRQLVGVDRGRVAQVRQRCGDHTDAMAAVGAISCIGSKLRATLDAEPDVRRSYRDGTVHHSDCKLSSMRRLAGIT